MERQRHNRLKAANERVQSVVHLDSAEREQARPQVKIVLAEKEKTGTWLSEQMGHNFFDKRVQSRTRSSYAERRKSRTQFNISTFSRWMTNRSALWDACQSNKVQPSVEPLGFAACLSNKVQPSVEPLGFAACQSKNSTRLHATSTRM